MNGELFLSVLFGLASLGVCLLAIPLGRWLKVVDLPDGAGGRKRHGEATPLVGGLAVFAAVSMSLIFINPGTQNFILLGLYAAFFMLGFTDDRGHVRPGARLLLSFVASWVAIYYAPAFEVSFLRFSFLPYTLFLDEWSVLFTVLCIVGLQNAVNMADGKNGLVIGQSLIWTVLLFLYAPPHLQPLLTTLMIVLGIILVFNLQGKLFLGDAGSYSLSVLIGLLAIYVYNQKFTDLSADMVALWFLLPVLDCIRIMVSRVIRGTSPFSGDRNHLHHLIAAQILWRYGLAIYLAMVGIPAVFAVLLPEITPLLALIITLGYALLYLLLTRRIVRRTPAKS